jgi:excisionase family DNA binding protein
METTLTIQQAAERLELSESRVRKLAQDGRLGRKVGRDWLFSEEELTAFLATPRPAGRPPRD